MHISCPKFSHSMRLDEYIFSKLQRFIFNQSIQQLNIEFESQSKNVHSQQNAINLVAQQSVCLKFGHCYQ